MANFLCFKFFILWEFRDFLVLVFVIVIVYNNNNKNQQTRIGHKMEIVRLEKSFSKSVLRTKKSSAVWKPDPA